MEIDDDALAAFLLHEELNGVNKNQDERKSKSVALPKGTSLIDPEWEMVDPNPDIIQLFRAFNDKFFWNKLGAVEVKWSPRMYSCAGICTYKGAGGCIVSLSLPLLKLRPRKDLVETLLHEMIHAYLFITKNDKDRDGHGPEFHKHMYRINKEAGTHITVYHTFHDEVRHYKTHVWRCNGPCKTKPPFFGLVRRAMNRAPGPNDFWYAEHQQRCGGTFTKIEEPENFKSRKKPNPNDGSISKIPISKKNTSVNGKQPGITSFFSPNGSKFKNSSNKNPNNNVSTNINSQKNSSTSGKNHFFSPVRTGGAVAKHGKTNNLHGFINLGQPAKSGTSGSGEGTESGALVASVAVNPFSGKGYILSSGTVNDRSKSKLLSLYSSSSLVKPPPKRPPEDSIKVKVSCPVCNKPTLASDINEHLDSCSGLDQVYESTNTIVLDSDDEEEGAAASSLQTQSFPCPNCSSLFKESDINNHLDQCLSFN